MLIIFWGSTDALSSHNTSRFLAPLIGWLLPGLSEQEIIRMVFIVRKGGHFMEYAVLAILRWRARRYANLKEPDPWSWADAVWAFLIAAVYAVTDELHQHFVASRWASVGDVFLDSTGAALGLLHCILFERLRPKQTQNPSERECVTNQTEPG